MVASDEPIVTIPVALYRTIRDWLFYSNLLDRIRINYHSLVPMTFGDHLAAVRSVFIEEAPNGDTVAIPESVWRIVKEWPALLDRARTSGVPMSMNDLTRLAESFTLLPQGEG